MSLDIWTVYALILPAITLESKKCNIEEHTHSAECYSESQELICGKEEHVHTAECTSINNDLSDSGEEAGTVPDASGNDANGNEEGKNTPEESVIPEESVVPAEPEPSSGTGTTETPGETGEYVLNDHTDQITSVTFTYKKNGKEVEVDKGQTIDTPDDLSMNIKVVFKSIPVATLIEHNGKFVYNLPKEFQIKETTTKNMTQDSDVIGTITVDTNGKVVVAYNDEYLKKLGTNSTISGNFFASAELKLNSVTEKNGQTTVKTPKGDITINLGTDYNEHYGTVAVTKQCSKEKEDKSGDYIKYTITVTAGEDGIKNLYVVDQFTENKNLVNYVGIEKTKKNLDSTANQQNPYETITNSESRPAPGTIYLTNEANSGQKIPESITDTTAVTEPGSFVWNIAEMKAGEIRTLTYFVKLKDKGGLINTKNGQNITNVANLYTKGSNDQVYDKFEKNDKPGKPEEPEEPEETKIHVLKVWKQDQEKERPDSIVVELLQTDVEGNTTVVDRQTLTKENQWSYTWKNLSTLMRWSVSEAEVPNGYTVAVVREGNTVVLTNTAKKPGKSDGEVNPPSKKPTDKTTNKTTDKTSDKTSDKLPQTGQLWWPVLVLLFAGAICLLVGRVLRDRKEEKNR